MTPLATIEHLAHLGMLVSISADSKGDFVVSLMSMDEADDQCFTALGRTIPDALEAVLKPFRGASPALGQGNGKGMGVASPEGGDA